MALTSRGNKTGYNIGMAKVMISLKDDLLRAIDKEAAGRHTSRSAFLALAASRELARRDSATVQAAIARSEQRFRGAGSFEAADLVRDDRDSRR
jgi:predicted transcriptional regulator